MDDVILKYGFTYGPLMLFFLSIGLAVWKWGPPVANALTNIFRETVAALNASTTALENSTRALSANNDATSNLMRTHESLSTIWEEMRERMDSFQCAHYEPTKITSLVQRQKKVQAISNQGGQS